MVADEGTLQRVAARQRGLFTRSQARGCGYSPYQVRQRIERDDWQHMLGPVFAFRGTRRTPGLLDVAASLAVPGAVLAGPSAARLHGMPVRDHRPWIVVPPEARPHVAGLGVLRDRLSRFDLLVVGDLLVTSRSRAVFDCVRILPDREALDLLERALQQRWTALDDLASRVRAFTGRHGVGRLVRLVASVSSGGRSAAERHAIGLLRRAGVRGYRVNEPIRDHEGILIGIGDLVFVTERVIVELDGRAYHSTSDRFERDRYRQNRLTGAGWIVLRFTWRDLTQRPDYVIATIKRMLEDRRSGNRSASRTSRSFPN